MIMSKVLPDNGYLIGLNGLIVPGDEESEYIKTYVPVCSFYHVLSEACKLMNRLKDSLNDDKKDKEPVEPEQD